MNENTNLFITLNTDLFSLETDSISIVLNGATLTQVSEDSLTSGSFTFNPSSGLISISDLGSNNGTLSLSVFDSEGISLTTFSFDFLISANAIKMGDPLFYPNPFLFDQNDLQLGFSATRSGTVSVYFYNMLGYEVHKHEEAITNIGYKTINFGNSPSFLSSGMYLCRIVVSDINGNEDIKLTKLAIY